MPNPVDTPPIIDTSKLAVDYQYYDAKFTEYTALVANNDIRRKAFQILVETHQSAVNNLSANQDLKFRISYELQVALLQKQPTTHIRSKLSKVQKAIEDANPSEVLVEEATISDQKDKISALRETFNRIGAPERPAQQSLQPIQARPQERTRIIESIANHFNFDALVADQPPQQVQQQEQQQELLLRQVLAERDRFFAEF